MLPFNAMRLRGSGGGGGDPYWANVVSLLHCNGVDTGTTYTDETGKTWTNSGNITTQTAIKVFGTAAFVFPGNNGTDYLSTPDHADWEFGSGDFTIEMRLRAAEVTLARGALSKLGGGDVYGPFLIYRIGTALNFYASSNGATADIVNGASIGTVAIDTWYAVAISRVGNNIYCFLDGTLNSTTDVTGDTLYNNAGDVLMGTYSTATGSWFGYIDEFRITKGVGRYTSSYTPATAEFPNS